jgi:hypothetical protein
LRARPPRIDQQHASPSDLYLPECLRLFFFAAASRRDLYIFSSICTLTPPPHIQTSPELASLIYGLAPSALASELQAHFEAKSDAAADLTARFGLDSLHTATAAYEITKAVVTVADKICPLALGDSCVAISLCARQNTVLTVGVFFLNLFFESAGATRWLRFSSHFSSWC